MNKKYIALCLIFLMITTGLCGCVGSVSEKDTITIGDEKYTQKKNLHLFLVIATNIEGDINDYDGTECAEADDIQLLIVNAKAKTYAELAIDESLIADCTLDDEISKDCESICEDVSDLLYGVEIEKYLALPYGTIGHINNLLGGISVDGKVLTDEEAESLCHDKADNETNIDRMERQTKYYEAAKPVYITESKRNIRSQQNFMNNLTGYYYTNMDSFDATVILNAMTSAKSQGLYELDGSSNDDKVIKELFFNEVK